MDRDKRYNGSRKGKARTARYEHSEKARARKRRWYLRNRRALKVA